MREESGGVASVMGRSARRTVALGLVLMIALVHAAGAQAPPRHTRNVVLIVPDGVRWQEVFRGAERALVGPDGGVSDTTALLRAFWRESAGERRRALLPFLWETIAQEGQVIGNPADGDTTVVTNGLKFSYPGYNEMLAGAPDPRIRSNSHGPNPNRTVFAWLASRPGLAGRVSAFATWGAFRDIFDAPRSGVTVRAGWEPPFPAPVGERQELINELHRTTIRLWPDNTLDVLTHQAVLEHIRRERPRVLFVGYGETDEWAHAGRYDLMLRAARQVDAFIGELWQVMQAIPQYRDSTTFLITTDHGRGEGPRGWTRHGEDVEGAESIWMAVIGPDTPAARRATGRVTQAQVAATLAALLGEDWTAASPGAANPIPGVIR